MNWAEIESRWEQLSPVLRAHWPELGPDELGRVDRRREALADVLRRRYGWTAEEAEARICAFEEDVRFPGAVK